MMSSLRMDERVFSVNLADRDNWQITIRAAYRRERILLLQWGMIYFLIFIRWLHSYYKEISSTHLIPFAITGIIFDRRESSMGFLGLRVSRRSLARKAKRIGHLFSTYVSPANWKIFIIKFSVQHCTVPRHIVQDEKWLEIGGRVFQKEHSWEE